MAHGHGEHTLDSIRNPGPFKIPSRMNGIFIGLAIIGVIVFAAALSLDHTRAWSSFVANHFFFFCLGIGGLFFAGVQWATNAMWSAPVRRIAEGFAAYLPFALVSVIILFFGAHDLYHWTHHEAVAEDVILQGKSPYLNMTFFVIRNLLFFGIWFFFVKKLIGNSLAQDKDGDIKYTHKNKVMSPLFLIFFAITFTLASFDQIMSLDPHWFSTIFGVYCFAGLFYSTLALLCIFTIYLRKQGYLEGIVNDNHLHDIGKFMFAFTVFWAYIGFSQFMLIWYANIPEETGYFLKRMHGNWIYISGFLIAGKFLTPFLFLMPRDAKRKVKVLIPVAIFMLLAQWIDIIWMVQPEFFANGPKIGWIEIGMFLGFAGVFGFSVFRFLSRNNIVAIKDPRLVESVFHHHQ